MTTQLTLISVPASPARQDAGAEPADVAPNDRTRSPFTPPARTRAAQGPSADVLPFDADRSAAPTAQRRSAGHQGWLDGRTISSGLKGIAAARAALADANQRVADRQAQEEAAREAELARQASGIVRPDRHAA